MPLYAERVIKKEVRVWEEGRPISHCHSERSEESRPSRMILGIQILRCAQYFTNENVSEESSLRRTLHLLLSESKDPGEESGLLR